MTAYRLRLTPVLVTPSTEGSMDTAILNGYSIQRTGFIEVYNSTNRKIVSLVDGNTFNDTMTTWADNVDLVDLD